MDAFGDILLGHKPLSQQDLDHSLEKQTVRAGPEFEMDVGQLRRLRIPGIHDSQQKAGLFFLVPDYQRGPGKPVTHHGVDPPENKEIRIGDVRGGVETLAAVGFPIHPVKAGEFLAQRVVIVL